MIHLDYMNSMHLNSNIPLTRESRIDAGNTNYNVLSFVIKYDKFYYSGLGI